MLGDDIQAALPEMRAQAESLMTEQCVIERNTGQSVYDPDTHQNEPVWEHVYTGKCRIRPASGSTAATLAQLFGQQINSVSQVGTLPLAVTAVKASDRLTVIQSGDLGQVGKQYTLLGVQAASLAVARRFIATDDQG